MVRREGFDLYIGLEEVEIERRVSARMARQVLLTRVTAPTVLEVVRNEAVLRRPVGGAKVMLHQLERLRKVSELPSVSLRVMPFSAGLHPSALSGPFVAQNRRSLVAPVLG